MRIIFLILLSAALARPMLPAKDSPAKIAAKAAAQQQKQRRAEEKREARHQAWLARQQWRADHPAEAAYQDAVAAYQSQQLFNFGMNLLFPPKVTCTSYAWGWTVETVCR
jgi:hypothetical protein